MLEHNISYCSTNSGTATTVSLFVPQCEDSKKYAKWLRKVYIQRRAGTKAVFIKALLY